jgi:hypothetical protein
MMAKRPSSDSLSNERKISRGSYNSGLGMGEPDVLS